jgi:hypothetical protein
MRRRSEWLAVALVAALCVSPAWAKGSSGHIASKPGGAKTAKVANAPKPPKPEKAPAAKTSRAPVPRDDKSSIQRSAAARHAFARQTGYPNGRPGYVIDHVVPLACGGTDAPSNMQWQTVAAGKAKDKVERKNCQ